MVLPNNSIASLQVSGNTTASQNVEIVKNLNQSFNNLKMFNVIYYESRAIFNLHFIMFDTFGNLIPSILQLNETIKDENRKIIKPVDWVQHNYKLLEIMHLKSNVNEVEESILSECKTRSFFKECFFVLEVELLKFCKKMEITFELKQKEHKISLNGIEKTFEEKINDFRKNFKMSQYTLKIYYNRYNPMNFFKKLVNIKKPVFRSNLSVSFSNERGIDAGGPKREFITLLFKDILTKKGLNIFIFGI